jgi:hypothetical protein
LLQKAKGWSDEKDRSLLHTGPWEKHRETASRIR